VLLSLRLDVGQHCLNFKRTYCAMPIFAAVKAENTVLAPALLLAKRSYRLRSLNDFLVAYHICTSYLPSANG